VADRLIRLPLFAGMRADELAWIVESVLAYRPRESTAPPTPRLRRGPHPAS
jgi:hypothetical protein